MELKPHERLDDLQIGGLSLIQDMRGFCFGIDAVLLSSFPEIKKGDMVLDMCTGTGIIPILLSAKTSADKIYAVEIQAEMAEMAKRSVLYNNISNVEIINGDIKNSLAYFEGGFFDVITCNPPYIPNKGGLVNPFDMKAVSRHEILCTLEDVIKQSASLLRFGGKLCMIHKPERLSDIICTMRKYKIEPKRILYVHPSLGREPNLLLIEGSLGGGAFLKTLPPLYVYNESGNYTDEINKIYGRS